MGPSVGRSAHVEGPILGAETVDPHRTFAMEFSTLNCRDPQLRTLGAMKICEVKTYPLELQDRSPIDRARFLHSKEGDIKCL